MGLTHKMVDVVSERAALHFPCACGERINLWVVQYDVLVEPENPFWWAVTHEGSVIEFEMNLSVEPTIESDRVCTQIQYMLGRRPGSRGCELRWITQDLPF